MLLSIPPLPRPLRSLRLALLLPAVLLNLLAGLGVAYLALGNARDTVSELSTSLHDQIARNVVERLNSFVSLPPRVLRPHAGLVASRSLPLHDVAALRHHLVAEIQNHTELSSHYLAFAAGGMVGAGMDQNRLYVTGTDTPAAGRWHKSWADPQGTPTQEITVLANFDARLRPWFKAAVAAPDDQVV